MSGIHTTELVSTCLSVTFLKQHHPKEEWAFSQCGLQVLKEPGNVFKRRSWCSSVLHKYFKAVSTCSFIHLLFK